MRSEICEEKQNRKAWLNEERGRKAVIETLSRGPRCLNQQIKHQNSYSKYAVFLKLKVASCLSKY
jgi:hypothetical protein